MPVPWVLCITETQAFPTRQVPLLGVRSLPMKAHFPPRDQLLPNRHPASSVFHSDHILSTFPQLIALRLQDAHKCIHGKADLHLPTGALRSHFTIINPPRGGKIDGLCTVEAVVEASMIAIGKCHHELPSLLSHAVKGDPIVPEHCG